MSRSDYSKSLVRLIFLYTMMWFYYSIVICLFHLRLFTIPFLISSPFYFPLNPFSAAKIDEDTGDYHVERVSFDFAKALQQARLEKKMTQAQLAQLVNEKANVINDYEGGRVSQLDNYDVSSF